MPLPLEENLLNGTLWHSTMHGCLFLTATLHLAQTTALPTSRPGTIMMMASVDCHASGSRFVLLSISFEVMLT